MTPDLPALIDPTSVLQQWLDRAAITDVLIAMANATDAHDWDRLRSLLADELYIDRSEIDDEPPTVVQTDAWVEALAADLARSRTLHQCTNHEIDLTDNSARCRSAFRFVRIDESRLTGTRRVEWVGHFDHDLVRAPLGWVICGIRQSLLYRDGIDLEPAR